MSSGVYSGAKWHKTASSVTYQKTRRILLDNNWEIYTVPDALLDQAVSIDLNLRSLLPLTARRNSDIPLQTPPAILVPFHRKAPTP